MVEASESWNTDNVSASAITLCLFAAKGSLLVEASCSTIVANGGRSAQLGLASHDSPLNPGHIEARSSEKSTIRIRLVYCLLLCLSTPLFAIDRDRRIDQIQHTSWTAREGAPGSIHAMAQTTEGYLWLGTDGGLVRFDGIHFDRYQAESGPPLPTHSVAALMAAPDGGLWISFVYGGVSFLISRRSRCQFSSCIAKTIRSFHMPMPAPYPRSC
jgi:hypothetical protein